MNYNRKEIDNNGNIRYYLNDKLHRIDGPAVEYTNGDKVWWINGQLHRIDGPAVEWADGRKYWYINGAEHTEKEFNEYINNLKIPKYFEL